MGVSQFHSEVVMQWASAFWASLRVTAPFLVVGLLLAGGLHAIVPTRLVLWVLGYRGWRGAVRGSLVGLPLPLSASKALPAALTLRHRGASLSATTSLLIATPATGVDTIAVTLALLPVSYSVVGPVAAVLFAVIVGVVVE